MLTIDLVRHMKAKDRRKWTAAQDERPLSKLGVRQAAFHVEAMLAGEAIDAIYCSPALRCRMTIEPLAERLGLEVRTEPLLAETNGYAEPSGWAGFDFGLDKAGGENPMGPAYWAGSGLGFVRKVRQTHPQGGRIVACSHGDTIPLIVASLAGLHSLQPPAPLWGFGGWYRVRFEGNDVTIERIDEPSGFNDL